MRESIGGAWLFGIVITFIFFFSAFLAYSISYTKAFNVKNEIINLIEHNEGFTTYAGSVDIKNASDSVLNESVEGKAYAAIKRVGYNIPEDSAIKCDGGKAMPGGYCLIKYCPYSDSVSGTYYKVTTFISFELPIFRNVFAIPISGETRTIYTDNSGYECN